MVGAAVCTYQFNFGSTGAHCVMGLIGCVVCTGSVVMVLAGCNGTGRLCWSWHWQRHVVVRFSGCDGTDGCLCVMGVELQYSIFA